MTSGPFAFVRNLQTSGGSNLKDFAQIQSAERHAKRQDKTSKARQVKGRSHTANYFWSKTGEGLAGGGADYAAAYKAHKKAMGITTERKGAAIGQHLLVGVSPEWLAETGDPRDLNNPRVRALIEDAKEWAESWMGQGAVWAVRYDTDEKGAGIVDILASPVRTAHHKSGKSKPSISVRKANAELAEKWGRPNAFQAMQDDWAAHAQSALDKRLLRGVPKAETKREHLSPEDYADQLEATPEVQDARAEAERIKAEAREKANKMIRDAKVEQSTALTNALAENRTLKAENSDLKHKLGQWQAFVESTTETLMRLLGNQFEAVKGAINRDWANLAKKEDPAPTQQSDRPRQ